LESLPTNNEASPDTEAKLLDLNAKAVTYQGRATGFKFLSIVITILLVGIGVLWAMAVFFPSFVAGIPFITKFCQSMNWLFPLIFGIFFASSGMLLLSKIWLRTTLGEIDALKKNTA
jgi:hypothetical protein